MNMFNYIHIRHLFHRQVSTDGLEPNARGPGMASIIRCIISTALSLLLYS